MGFPLNEIIRLSTLQSEQAVYSITRNWYVGSYTKRFLAEITKTFLPTTTYLFLSDHAFTSISISHQEVFRKTSNLKNISKAPGKHPR